MASSDEHQYWRSPLHARQLRKRILGPNIQAVGLTRQCTFPASLEGISSWHSNRNGIFRVHPTYVRTNKNGCKHRGNRFIQCKPSFCRLWSSIDSDQHTSNNLSQRREG